ncbi:hypothetical protein BofuT4_uP091230.1 [Botrytis cinerea T4]|uniref:Uncharacterized protein n=1 Tax=Botryotinia fuckeliana (strain T4) TaxID=999810 RepID=G2YF43_BOTF4|nr:hypothetical protein BofuT4_uP091230.1 [Botrytis cinerea T4]
MTCLLFLVRLNRATFALIQSEDVGKWECSGNPQTSQPHVSKRQA